MNELGVRGIEIHTDCLDSAACTAGIRGEITDQLVQQPVFQKVDDGTGLCVDDEKGHLPADAFHRAELIKAEMSWQIILADEKAGIGLEKQGIDGSMGDIEGTGNVFLRTFLFGIQDGAQFGVFGDKAVLIHNRRRSGEGMAAVSAEPALLGKAEIGVHSGDLWQNDQGRLRAVADQGSVTGTADGTDIGSGISKKTGIDKGLDTADRFHGDTGIREMDIWLFQVQGQ
jgi:hypothetical protein